jgi:pimeloyl-ACP methyl ester carboxylesterase
VRSRILLRRFLSASWAKIGICFLMPYLQALIFFCLWTGLPPLVAAEKIDEIAPYDCQIEAKENENFNYSSVELWVPHGCREVRGILCLVLHPLDQGGATLAHPTPWIELANREGCALMAISFAQSSDSSLNWSRAEQGTGRALFAALDVLAQKTGISNLATSPITIAGVCAAGQFAFHLTAFAPTRITAFVTIGGGKHDLSKVEAAAKAPALIVVTPDRPYAIRNLDALYSEGRAHSAPWYRLSENISNYDAGLCASDVLSFLDSSLAHFKDASHNPLPANGTMETGPLRYLPVSICGKKLPILGIVQPVTIALGRIDSFSPVKPTCTLEVDCSPGSDVDAIYVPSRSPALQTEIRKTTPGHWNIICQIDQKKLPIGFSRLAVPIRFLHKAKQIPGGALASLTCFVTGDVTWTPQDLNLGALEPGKVFEIPLSFVNKRAAPIQIESVTSTHNWVQFTSSLVNGTPEFRCTVTPPTDIQGQGFGGYLQIKLRSPTYQFLRIFYYGYVNRKTGELLQDKRSDNQPD